MNKGKDQKVIDRYTTSDKIKTGYIELTKSVDKELKEYEDSLKMNSNIYSKLRKLYKFTDAIYSQYSDKSVCQKGCAHCCKIPVAMTDIEALYIERNTDHKIELTENIDKFEYCSFLDLENGVCTIYEFRPLSCRTYLTFDNPSYCEEGSTKHIHTTFSINTNLQQKFASLVVARNKPLVEKDIRNFFPRK